MIVCDAPCICIVLWCYDLDVNDQNMKLSIFQESFAMFMEENLTSKH